MQMGQNYLSSEDAEGKNVSGELYRYNYSLIQVDSPCLLNAVLDQNILGIVTCVCLS